VRDDIEFDIIVFDSEPRLDFILDHRPLFAYKRVKKSGVLDDISDFLLVRLAPSTNGTSMENDVECAAFQLLIRVRLATHPDIKQPRRAEARQLVLNKLAGVASARNEILPDRLRYSKLLSPIIHFANDFSA